MAPACASNARRSIRLDISVLDHLAPFLRIGLDECGILLRRAGDRLQRVGEEDLLAILRIGEDAPDLAVEPGDDIAGRAAGCEQPEPGARFETRHPAFGD